MEYKEKAKTSNAISRQSKGFKERKGEKNRLTKAKPRQGEEKKTDHDKSSKGNKREQAKQKLKQKQSKITDKQCKAMVGKHYKRANPSKAMEERKEQRVK